MVMSASLCTPCHSVSKPPVHMTAPCTRAPAAVKPFASYLPTPQYTAGLTHYCRSAWQQRSKRSEASTASEMNTYTFAALLNSHSIHRHTPVQDDEPFVRNNNILDCRLWCILRKAAGLQTAALLQAALEAGQSPPHHIQSQRCHTQLTHASTDASHP